MGGKLLLTSPVASSGGNLTTPTNLLLGDANVEGSELVRFCRLDFPPRRLSDTRFFRACARVCVEAHLTEAGQLMEGHSHEEAPHQVQRTEAEQMDPRSLQLLTGLALARWMHAP